MSVLETVWEEEGLRGEPGRESLSASAVEFHPGETIAPSANIRQLGEDVDDAWYGLPHSDATQCESLCASPERTRHSVLSPTGPRGVGEIEHAEEDPQRLVVVGSLAHPEGVGPTQSSDASHVLGAPCVESGLNPAKSSQGWRGLSRLRKKVWRVLQEMRWWYQRSGKLTRAEGELEEADTAESLKHWLLFYMPDNEESLADQSATASSLWDRLVLVKLRVQGHRSDFVEVYSWVQRHRLLVLKVPPENSTPEKRLEHARRQASYQDDEYGNFLPGMRVRWEKWLPFVEGEDAEWVEQMRSGGQPILLSDKPKAYWRQAGNYQSFTEHSEKGAAEFRRLV